MSFLISLDKPSACARSDEVEKSLSFLLGKLKLVAWAYVTRRNKNSSVPSEQRFHCSGKNKTCRHVPAMKRLLCNLGDSAQALNALTLTFKTGITQQKDGR